MLPFSREDLAEGDALDASEVCYLSSEAGYLNISSTSTIFDFSRLIESR